MQCQALIEHIGIPLHDLYVSKHADINSQTQVKEIRMLYNGTAQYIEPQYHSILAPYGEIPEVAPAPIIHNLQFERWATGANSTIYALCYSKELNTVFIGQRW